jgi:cytochrome c-type biogenesis protein
MGLHFLGILKIGLLYRQFRADVGETNNMSIAGSFVIGMAFAFGWTPCVGPVLAAILFTAAGADSAVRGASLLFVYGAGMTIPFVLAAAFIGPFMRWMAKFRKYLPTVEKIMGALLLVFAALIATDSMNIIAEWMLNYVPALG